MVKIVGQDNNISIKSDSGDVARIVGQENNTLILGDSTKITVEPAMLVELPRGINGKDGINGINGRDGIDGKDGRDGIDGRDGVDGKNGVTFIPHYDEKTGEFYFTNDGGLPNPKKIKIPKEKGWGFGVGRGGGVTAQSDWNQTDKNAVDYIKNKPSISSTSYVHEQGIASSEWVIQHNLDKYPSVSVVDSAENEIIAEVKYINKNKLKVIMNGASKGRAYLN